MCICLSLFLRIYLPIHPVFITYQKVKKKTTQVYSSRIGLFSTSVMWLSSRAIFASHLNRRQQKTSVQCETWQSELFREERLARWTIILKWRQVKSQRSCELFSYWIVLYVNWPEASCFLCSSVHSVFIMSLFANSLDRINAKRGSVCKLNTYDCVWTCCRDYAVSFCTWCSKF